jgi:molybdenum cofactor biosynthesis protein B
MPHQTAGFSPSQVAVVTISDTRTLETDTSGGFICQSLQDAGHDVVDRVIVKDDLEVIRRTVKNLLDSKGCQFIICTGGTGLTVRDVTPDALAPLYTKFIPGFGELFRMLSYDDIGTSTIQSRAEAGLCGHAVVFALPGSTGACRLAMEKIILQQIDPTHKPCNFRGILPS